jgi:homoserine kinase
MSDTFRLRLPATSANLGPGFDAAAVALDFFLEIEAEPAEQFSIAATGRDADRCGRITDNLILDTYNRLLAEHGIATRPLALRMNNGIPLGMGCGSSAAGRLAAIALAEHFGPIPLTSEQILEEATSLEGHPDNAAACWLGGFVTAATEGRTVYAARVTPPRQWRAIVVLPPNPLATSAARALLPDSYSRRDAVSNVQSAALLGLAFAQGRGELLQVAMKDRMHQPFRARVCPLLQPLLGLTGREGVLGVALSGAGPAVMVIVDSVESVKIVSAAIHESLSAAPEPELLVCRFEPLGAAALRTTN